MEPNKENPPEAPARRSAQKTADDADFGDAAPRLTPSAQALRAAHRVLLRVDSGAYATLALAGELERARLPESARGLCTELVYGTLRQQPRLDRALSAYAPRGLGSLDPTALAVLRLGAYQLMFLGVPPHAVVSQAVELLSRLRGKGLAGFANALLRRLQREGEPALPAATGTPAQITAALSLRHCLPTWIVADALRRFPQPEAEALLAALATPAPTWLRLSAQRGPLDASFAALKAEAAGARRPFPELPDAVRLDGGFPFRGAAYGAGRFTAQDLGAQLVGRLLVAPVAGQSGPPQLPAGAVLDACAGVGGKTAHLSELFGGTREIDAADQSARKLELCADHAHRLGCRGVRTIQADLLSRDAPLRPQYAAVVLDAPCSGLGVLRRHPEARFRTTPDSVRALAQVQAGLLAALAPRVAPGGLLVYSVCSYLEEEGPAQVAAFLRAHPDFRPLPPDAGQAPWAGLSGGPPLIDAAADGALRTYPHRHDADGFYALRMIRG